MKTGRQNNLTAAGCELMALKPPRCSFYVPDKLAEKQQTTKTNIQKL
jgi:hypothetical protein